MKLSQPKAPNVASHGHGKKELKGGASSGSTDKLKASNFPASVLRIGTWEVYLNFYVFGKDLQLLNITLN